MIQLKSCLLQGLFSSTLILGFIGLTACDQTGPANEKQATKVEKVEHDQQKPSTENALTFINGYIEFSNEPNSSYSTVDWVKMNGLTTKTFIKDLESIFDEAYKEDPEMGLGFDPILDAQDYPSDGFELDSFDEKTNYLIVKGINMPEFKVTMRIWDENGKWLVDGCGIVNMPK